MPSKSKAPALDRLVRWCRRNLRVVEVNPGAHSSRLCYHMRMDNTEARAIIQRVADECAWIADESGRFRQDAVDAIRRELGIGEGENG